MESNNTSIDFNKYPEFSHLFKIVKELRVKCPWDKEQTWESLRPMTLEESAELADAIIGGDKSEIKKEIGDVLLHVLFYSILGEEESLFDFESVCKALREKLISRHPHIYGDVNAEDSEQVKKNWESIKLEKEKTKSVLSGVPKSLSGLVKAQRLQEKASSVGFDWDNKIDVWNKVKEELLEFEEATNPQEREEEFGDLLFSLVNFARFEKINPDNAIQKTNHKFLNRFTEMEAMMKLDNLEIQNMTLSEMDIYWEKAKNKLK